jgi:hypothetical protein
MELVDLAVNGSVTYRPAGKYTASMRVTGTFQLNYPASCLDGATCGDLDAALKDSLAGDPSSPVRSVSCKGQRTCECLAELRPNEIEEGGSYETKGNVVTMTNADDDTVSRVQYCASGKTLYMAEDNRGESPELVLRKK